MLRSLSADERVNSAVVHTAFNLLGLATIFVVYLNYVMVADYLTPVFLAAVLAVLLRGLRDTLSSLPLIEAIKAAESQQHQQRAAVTMIGDHIEEASSTMQVASLLLTPVRVPLRKMGIVWRCLFAPLVSSRRRQALSLAVAALWLAALVWSLNNSPWTFLLATTPFVVATFTLLCVLLVPVNTLIALFLVFTFVIVASCVGVAFATGVVVESAEFSYALAASVHETLGDEAKTPQFLVPWLKALNPGAIPPSGAAGAATAAAASASIATMAALPDWAPSGMDRLVHVAQALYTSRKMLLQSNDTRGFQRAVKTLQGILNLDDELYRTILSVNVGQLFAHPLDTVGKLIVNSAVVLRALWNALSQFGSQLTMTALSLSLSFFNYTFSAVVFLAALFYLLQSETLFLDRLLDFTSHKHAYKRVIVSYLRGIFLASFWSFVLNAVCTGVAFWLFGGKQKPML